MDGDGIQDHAVGVFLDDDGGNGRGAVYVLFLNADRTVRDVQKISSTQGGFTGPLNNSDEMSAPTPLGDLNGDTIPDLAIGAVRDDDGGTDRGAVYLVFLNRDGTVKAETKISQTQGGFGGTLADQGRFGGDLVRLGDLDGDGVTELAVWSVRDNLVGVDRGAVWILFLRANGTVRDQVRIADGAGGFPGGILADGDGFGQPTAPGDLDGDGVADLVVGARGDDGAGTDRGAIFVLFLNPDGTVKTSPAPIEIRNGLAGFPPATLADGDTFGDVTAIGDVDGNGVTDLVVGADHDDDGGAGGAADRGAAYVLFLDGQPAVCGDGVLDPLEECDDGGNLSGDLCSATCERETWLALRGTTSGGGSFEVTVDGNLVVQPTSSGQTIPQVLTALAASIEAADPDLEALVNGSGVLYTNGSITDVVDNDAGLDVGPGPENGFPLELSLSFQLGGVSPLEASGEGVAPARWSTPLGRLRELDWGIATWTQTDDLSVTLENSVLWSISGIGGPGPVSMTRLSLPGPQPAAAFGMLYVCRPYPLCGLLTVPLHWIGGGIVTTTTTASGPLVVSHGSWTFSTPLPTSFASTTRAVGFMHGPISNSLTAGRDGGVLQLVAPTRVSSSNPSIGDFELLTRLTITMPEPASPLLLGAGVSLLLGLYRLRRRRR